MLYDYFEQIYLVSCWKMERSRQLCGYDTVQKMKKSGDDVTTPRLLKVIFSEMSTEKSIKLCHTTVSSIDYTYQALLENNLLSLAK